MPAANGYAGMEKPRLSMTERPLEGVRTRTPRCDTAKHSTTLMVKRPDGPVVQNEEATAILHEPDMV